MPSRARMVGQGMTSQQSQVSTFAPSGESGDACTVGAFGGALVQLPHPLNRQFLWGVLDRVVVLAALEVVVKPILNRRDHGVGGIRERGGTVLVRRSRRSPPRSGHLSNVRDVPSSERPPQVASMNAPIPTTARMNLLVTHHHPFHCYPTSASTLG